MAEAIVYDYLLTIRVPIKAIDDMQARETVKEFLTAHRIQVTEAKLQQLHQGKPPTGVNL